MATTLEFQLIDRDFRAAIARLLQAGTDLAPLMGTLAGHLAAIPERAFEAEQDPFGLPWAPLSPRYAARKRQQGWSPKILERTGELKGSIAAQAGDDYAEVVIGAPYAIYHQLGTRTLPPRPFLGMDAEGERDVRTATLDYLRNALNG